MGLHTGKKSNYKILPGEADQGIVFKRVDLKEKNLINANYKNVSSAKTYVRHYKMNLEQEFQL